MNNQILEEVSVEEVMKEFNLIVPEIQREYVWGNNENQIVDTFLEDIKLGKKQSIEENESKILELDSLLTTPEVSDFLRDIIYSEKSKLENNYQDLNIGFLYSYLPGYGNVSKSKDLYLIDGQQRFTTLFLLLFYFALKECRLSDFYDLFKIDTNKGKLGFDYRVRSLTHHFLVEMLIYVKDLNQLQTIRDQSWFLKNFSLDVTIKAIVGERENNKLGVFALFDNHFKGDDESYCDFLKSNVKFWHFKTDETSQGEELYITMNSRGQQLKDNESLRAKLFDEENVRSKSLYWSEKWELWQDYFWKNKNSLARSADMGFDEFLRWVCIISYLDLNSEVDSSSLMKEQDYIDLVQGEKGFDYEYLDIEKIDKYFNVISFLFDSFQNYIDTDLKTYYPKSEKYIETIFPKKDFLGHDVKYPLSQNALFRLLPVIKYTSQFEDFNKIDKHNLFRVIKFINNVSKDDNVGKASRLQIINIIKFIKSLPLNSTVWNIPNSEYHKYDTIFNEEQYIKLIYYREVKDLLECEDLFWYAESIDPQKYNENIRHLIEANQELDERNSEQFNLKNFQKILCVFEEYIKYEDIILGNLIPTNIYKLHYDKIIKENKFYLKDDFKKYLLSRLDSFDQDLSSYLIKRQQIFIQTYTTVNLLLEEKNLKNQLYVYYILKDNQLLPDISKWNWDGRRFNFGVYIHPKNGYFSFFKHYCLFQLINSSFQRNEYLILDLHTKEFTVEEIFDTLSNWNNS